MASDESLIDDNAISPGPAAAPAAEPVVHSHKARGSFDIRSKRAGSGPNKKMYLGVALIILVFLVVVIGVWSLVIGKMKEGTTQVDESKVKSDATLQIDQGNDDSMATARAEKVRQMQEQEQKELGERERREAQQREAKPADTAPASQSGSPAPDRHASQDTDKAPLTPMQRKLLGGVVIAPNLQDVSASGATVAGSADSASRSTGHPSGRGYDAASLSEAQANLDGGGAGGGSFSPTRGSLSNLSGTRFAPGAAVLAPARKYLLAHNTYTRCALYTEIVTDQPGLIDCRLTEPLYSADGSTVLANAGDRLTGEQSVEVKPGQVNVFTSWTELETQSGVRARLDSLGAGPLGASGTEAWIDNHYKQRFGGAVMLSFIQDALQAAANTTQKSSGSGGYTVNNSEQNVENMASKALDNTINIAPTAHISPGTVMTVIVARDIDFSSVYENR